MTEKTQSEKEGLKTKAEVVKTLLDAAETARKKGRKPGARVLEEQADEVARRGKG